MERAALVRCLPCSSVLCRTYLHSHSHACRRFSIPSFPTFSRPSSFLRRRPSRLLPSSSSPPHFRTSSNRFSSFSPRAVLSPSPSPSPGIRLSLSFHPFHHLDFLSHKFHRVCVAFPQVNDEVALELGFQKVSEEFIPECKSKAVLFRHIKTGAQVMSVSNDDENKVFGIVFRTPP